MHHEIPLITTIVAGLVLAYIFGMIAHRLKMPPLVGYLFAGILAGPYTPGFVADQALGAELAELGVILLMFGVGLHFSLKDLMSVRALAIPGALAQIGFATLLGLGLASLMGWSLGAGLLFGLALSVASTVVLLKALQERRLIETERGRIAVGWLIVEDLAMVLALVMIPAIASLSGDTGVHDPFVSFVTRLAGIEIGVWGILGLTVLKVAAFVGFMLIVGRRVIPWALHGTAHTGSRELFRLAVLAIALGVALGSALLFGVSLALGAFFAGMILSESELSHRAAQETLPLRDAFAVLFFVSVGMLFDPSIIITDPLPVLATVFIIVIGKSLAAFAIVLLFRRPVGTALTISASLAQIGEFSFILASMGVSLAILPPEGQDLILAGALISIVLNPVVFWAIDLAKPRLEARAALRKAGRPGEDVRVEPGVEPGSASADPAGHGVAEAAEPAEDDGVEPSQQTDHTVLVGFGRVGQVVGKGLHDAGAPLVLIEDTDHFVTAARALGIETVLGNAARADVLKLANLPAAKCLLIAIPNGFEAGTICEVGRKLSPSVRIIARAHSAEEEEHLRRLGADVVIMGEREIGMGMLAWLRGERVEGEAGETEASGPRLPPGENLLAKAGIAPAVLAAAVASTDETVDTVAPASGLTAAPEAAPEPMRAEAVIELPPPTIVEPMLDSKPAPILETPTPVEPVVDMAPAPAPVPEPEPAVVVAELVAIVPAAAAETEVEAGIPAAAEAEPVVDVAEADTQPAAVAEQAEIGVVPAPEPAEPVVETTAAAETVAEQTADEISEGGPVQPAVDAETDKPAPGAAPAVLPEPKN
jgi:CPA2 family monovalent cation:H+ antiporter-2